MPGAEPPLRPAATPLEALLRVTRLRRAGDGRSYAGPLLLAAAAGVGADGVTLHRVGSRTGLLRPGERVGDVAGAPVATAHAAEAALASGEEVVEEGRDDALSVLAIPAWAGERVLGVVCLAGRDLLLADEVRRHAARVAAARIGWLLEREQIHQALERAMTHVLEDDERMLGRIGLDIHDGPSQQLAVALLEVQLLEADLEDATAGGLALPERLRPALTRIYETLGGTLNEMRELIGHLRPAQLENRPLVDVLGDALLAFAGRSEAATTLETRGDAEGEAGISLSQRITFYRILQEALSNADRHGRATNVAVTLGFTRGGTTLEVRDDGTGFDVEAVLARVRDTQRAHFGLTGMRDRVAMLGGTISITSAIGRGTLVSVFLPRWRPSDPTVVQELRA